MATIWDGSKEVAPGSVAVLQDGAEVPASIAGIMPRGYASAAAMLAQPEFYVAHRGGSVDWPEMSLRGMTESVARGVGALEVSLSRTKDGIWFGMHDETLARTAGLTTAPKGSDLTWAQVQAYSNGGDRYYTFEELVEPWRDSHVFFVDPKYQHSTYRAEFFAKVKQLIPAGRAVLKYYGDNTGLADAARAAGIPSWGYFYQGDIDSGLFDRVWEKWDILGFPYDGSAAGWSAILSKGRPAMAHIIPTAAGVATAKSKGAKGFMVSGIRNVFGTAGL